MPQRLVFAVYAKNETELDHVRRFGESVWKYGGRFNNAPKWVFIPEHFIITDKDLRRELDRLGFEINETTAPESSKKYYYHGKPFAAADAEKKAESFYDIIVWVDEDTIMLDQPDEFDLKPKISFGYKPVMHNRAGSTAALDPSPFWNRIYSLLNLTEKQLFRMTTPVDKNTIRAYFQCGLLVLRPKKGVLRQWARDFEMLYNDPEIEAMCAADELKNVFLHQNALVGAVLDNIDKKEMVELSDAYNYPIFFERCYESPEPYDSIEKVATMRDVLHMEQIPMEWFDQLKGPADKIQWLKNQYRPY